MRIKNVSFLCYMAAICAAVVAFVFITARMGWAEISKGAGTPAEETGDCLKKAICASCGATISKTKYCAECGAGLDEVKPVFKEGSATEYTSEHTQAVEDVQTASKAMSDEGLTLLVNICTKTVATVGGDGYSEIVLYVDESTGEYWLHTYSKYVNMKEEAHASYTATPKLAQSVMEYIQNHKLALWKEQKGFAICGGDYIIRFKHGDEWIRLDSGNMTDYGKAFRDIYSMLAAEMKEENRRYAEQ
ncbi:MAG: hypothetical protein SPL05_07110 [Eubacteriales bacterium]|nr:hypothetical protein [Eubacteriales bacterium]